MQQSISFRRRLKHVRKDIQRNPSREEGIINDFQRETGIRVRFGYIIDHYLRHCSVPGRVVARIGRAAKKRGFHVSLYAFSDKKLSPHEVPFFRTVTKKEILVSTKIIETSHTEDNAGNKVAFTYSENILHRSEHREEIKC